MANQKVLTGALAVVRRNGITQAFMKSFSIQENFQRVDVRQLGSLILAEKPPISITCSASFDFHAISFRDSSITDAVNRGAFTINDFSDNFIFSDGIQIDIYKNVVGVTNEQDLRIKNQTPDLIGTITDAYIESDSMNVSEGGVGSRTQSFAYLTPILFKDI